MNLIGCPTVQKWFFVVTIGLISFLSRSATAEVTSATQADMDRTIAGRTPHLLYAPVVIKGLCLLRVNWTAPKGSNRPPNVFATHECPVHKDGTCAEPITCSKELDSSPGYGATEVFVPDPDKSRNEGFDKYGRQVKQHTARDEEANRVAVVSIPLKDTNYNMCVWPFWPVGKNSEYDATVDPKLNIVACKPTGYTSTDDPICPGLVACIDKEIPGAKAGVVASRQPIYPYPDLLTQGNAHASSSTTTLAGTSGHRPR